MAENKVGSNETAVRDTAAFGMAVLENPHAKLSDLLQRARAIADEMRTKAHYERTADRMGE